MARDKAAGRTGNNSSSISSSSGDSRRRRLTAEPDETLLQIGAAAIGDFEGRAEIADLHLELIDVSLERGDGSLTASHATAKDSDSLLGSPEGRRRLHIVATVAAVAVVAVVAAGRIHGGVIGHCGRKERRTDDSHKTMKTAESVTISGGTWRP